MSPNHVPLLERTMKMLRGWFGEKKTIISMWLSLDAKTYRRFHDVIIPSTSGTAQIDHLLVSPYGLFIVETKNFAGWIFGSEDQSKWTQVLYRKKYSFQNPLRQTFRQKKVLCSFLHVDESAVHPIVYFVGDCKFKTPLPPNVLRSGLGGYIEEFQTRILSPEEIGRVIGALETHCSESSFTSSDHVRSLKERHSSITVCPFCGSDLVKRIAKKGPNSGSEFLGCKSYPRCRFSKSE